MHAIFDVALPVFGIILAGYLVGRRGLLGETSSGTLNGFVYWVSLPALLFVSMAKAPLGTTLNVPFLAAYVLGAAASFLVTIAVGSVFFPRRLGARALQGLSAVFGNTGYFGIPLFVAAFGPDGALPAILVTAVNSALAIGAAVVLIELDLSPAAGFRHAARDAARALARNPLVIAPALGLAAAALGTPIPAPLGTFCSLLGAAAAPCALFALGLFLAGTTWSPVTGEIGWIALVKLGLQPLLTWALIGLAGDVDPFWSGACVLLAAMPTGSLVFTVAQRYDVYVEPASAAALATTILSMATLPIFLLLFGGH
jgi:malonate transporter and related proteins